jgi:N-acetylglucosaminyldiphosphoundecaprenol N-acetyl-beta-D-mannosaminyltransferase
VTQAPTRVGRAADAPPSLPPRRRASAIERVPILGVPIALTDYAGAMDWMDAHVASRVPVYVTASAVHLLMTAQSDPEARAATLGADLIVPDGQPLVWALRLLGRHLDARVYGPDLMAAYCRRSAGTGVRMYLYGGRSPEALALLTRALLERFPGLRIVGGHSPPFRELTDAERDAVVADIDDSGADVVWVGTGQPKQEKWMARMRPRLRAPVLVGVGAAFDFHAGLVPQAPPWMQSRGLEWVFRLWQEPRRLWRRYASDNPRFIAGFARQYVHHRRRQA